jgi:hypothetical protein
MGFHLDHSWNRWKAFSVILDGGNNAAGPPLPVLLKMLWQ